MMQKMCDAVVAGHICLDIIPLVTHEQIIFSPGRLLEIGPSVLSTGGPVSNTGLSLHKLGINTRLMGKVGDDLFGQAIQNIIAGYHPTLTEDMIVVGGEATSYSIILNPAGADRMFLHFSGCNDTFGADDINYEMLESARLFHFGYPPLMKRLIERDGAELIELFRKAKATGVTTSLDMTMPDPTSFSGGVDWPGILSTTLPYVDIFLPSIEEILFTLYRDRCEMRSENTADLPAALTPELVVSISEDLLSMGPKVVGLKLGCMGFYLRTANAQAWPEIGRARPQDVGHWIGRELWSPCFETTVVGTTGAGDTTIAGFLAALLRGQSPEESVTMACAVGACNVEAPDALSGVQSWDQTQSRISGWPHLPLPVEMTNWHCSKTNGLWYGPKDVGPDSRIETGGKR